MDALDSRQQEEMHNTAYYGSYNDNNVELQPKNLSFDNLSIRRGFIRKVYMILSAQLLVTFGTVVVIVYNENAKNYAIHNPWLFWLSLATILITMILMICSESARRKTPENFIFLGLFTVAESFMLSVAASRFAPQEVLLAVGITFVLCLALTVFAMQTSYDFTMMGGILIVCMVCLLVFGFVIIFVGGNTLSLIYATLGALLFSIYLVYDTQLMIGGKHKYAISPEEYIFAALNLYLDVINIFLDILSILGGTHD